MQEYQNRYIENISEIYQLLDIYSFDTDSFDNWYQKQQDAKKTIRRLKKDNVQILNEHLFPLLDSLYSAENSQIKDLEEFADKLMDWKINLDCGTYLLIHESLLNMYRVRKDRDGIIKELYKVGMGLYYQNRMIQVIDNSRCRKFYFENEMVFTEAASYLKYFEEIESEETKGYIIRSLANIAIATIDRKKRVHISSKTLNILQDEYYRKLAPGLPWDVFLRKTYQQMSSNRSTLSKGDLNPAELSAIMEACQVVFEPEKDNSKPNVRWLWPYYEMEYSCGFVDIYTTLQRMEELIESVSYDQYDMSGLYCNVQLAAYYGRLLKENENLKNRKRYLDFLSFAYRKMMKTLLTYPNNQIDDFFFYNISLVVAYYYETETTDSYLSVISKLIARLAGHRFIMSQSIADICETLALAVYLSDNSFFDDIEYIAAIKDPDKKIEEIRSFARNAGLYHNFGLIVMNIYNIRSTRNLYEREDEIYQLGCYLGHDIFVSRTSTEKLADIALGYHRWYDGEGGYPKDYVRLDSQYRKMTDIVSVAGYIEKHYQGDLKQLISSMRKLERSKFSPVIISYLFDPDIMRKLEYILNDKQIDYYRTLFNNISTDKKIVNSDD